MAMGGTAVVIEDDHEVGTLIQLILEQAGLHTIVVTNGADGLEAVREHTPLLTTLDVNLPGADGFAIARQLRDFSDTYLIFVTGMVNEIDMIRGFEAGADDYLVKPFRPRELRARADAMMRRYQRWQAQVGAEPPVVEPVTLSEPDVVVETSWVSSAIADVTASAAPAAAPAPAPAPAPPVAPAPAAPAAAPVEAAPTPAAPAAPVEAGTLRNGPIVAHVGSRSVQVEGRAVRLEPLEFDLLASLMESGRRVRSKAELALTVRGEGAGTVPGRFVNEAEKRGVDAHIATLKDKLGDSTDGRARLIEAVKGVGYRMVGQG